MICYGTQSETVWLPQGLPAKIFGPCRYEAIKLIEVKNRFINKLVIRPACKSCIESMDCVVLDDDLFIIWEIMNS